MQTEIKITGQTRDWLRLLDNEHNCAGAPTYYYRVNDFSASFYEGRDVDMDTLAAALNRLGFGTVAKVIRRPFEADRIKITDPVNQALVAEGILAE